MFVKSKSGVTGDDVFKAVGPVHGLTIMKRADTDRDVEFCADHAYHLCAALRKGRR